jgi:hypothetical protein
MSEKRTYAGTLEGRNPGKKEKEGSFPGFLSSWVPA